MGGLITVKKSRKFSYQDLKISVKLSIMYLVFLVISLIISFAIYTQISNQIIERKNEELSLQFLYSLKSNIYGMLESTGFNSRIIMANTDVQSILENENSVYLSESQRIVSKYLVSLMDSLPNIKSIYIFDYYTNRYGVDKNYLKKLQLNDIKQADWFEKVQSQEGYYILELNADRIFQNHEEENTVSLLRIINNTVTMEPIGVLMVNISESAFINTYKEIVNTYGTNVMILDNKNTVISVDGVLPKEVILDRFGLLDRENDSMVIEFEGKKYLCSYMSLPEYDWKIMIGIPLNQLKAEQGLYKIIFIIIMIFSGIFLLISVMIMSKTITNPIKILVDSMKQMESGQFIKVDMNTGNDEIGQLKENYNNMVDEIEKLIDRIYKEQKFKRKAELKVLQEQIKPHFLYNTIDTMKYLALTGETEDLYDALEAFGGYYRTSLSKGSEMITVESEINLIKDYLYLQKMRYGDIFRTVFEIDPLTLSYKTLKLIIQPLVENSIYHGIKPKIEKGLITIKTKLKGDCMIFEVEDDGVGMTSEELADISGENLDKNAKSFGLRGTFKRLSIYYERKDLCKIESEKGKGTKITIRIPITEGRDQVD